MKRIAAVLFAIGLLAGTASAQQKGAAKPKPAAAAPASGGTTNAAPRVRNYDFDADLINGELIRPEGDISTARRAAEHGSLIRPRADFVREIVKSAEDL